MAIQNALVAAPPYRVEEALTRLGANLRTARVRRKLSLQDVADKIGVGRHVVANAERGKPLTGVIVYLAMLWAYDLLDQLSEVADPARDSQGLALELASEKSRVRRREAMSNDF